MIKRILFSVLSVALLLNACSFISSQPAGQVVPTEPVSQLESMEPTSEPNQGTVEIPVVETTSGAESETPDCLGGEISPIGQSIAADYDFTDYLEVISWFCGGAEFEDILVALETESQTGTPAEEMLQMLADGFTWDEIWQLVGLTE